MNIKIKLITCSVLVMAMAGCVNTRHPEDQPVDLSEVHNYSIRHKVAIKAEAQLKHHQYTRVELESIRVKITPAMGRIIVNRNITPHQIAKRLENIPHNTSKLPWAMWIISSYDVRPVVTTRTIENHLVEASVVGYRGNFGYSPIRLYIDPKYPKNSCSSQFIVNSMKYYMREIEDDVLKTNVELTTAYNKIAHTAPHYQAGSVEQLRYKYAQYTKRTNLQFILLHHKKRVDEILYEAHSDSLFNKMKQNCSNH